MKKSTYIFYKVIKFLKLDFLFQILGKFHSFFYLLIPYYKLYERKEFRLLKERNYTFRLDISDYMQWAIYTDINNCGYKIAISNYQPNFNFFDVGSNVGEFTIKLASKLQTLENVDFTIYSFEPNNDTYGLFIHNVNLNPHLSTFIKPYNIGLSNTTGKGFLSNNKNNSGGNLILENRNNDSINIRVEKFDDFVIEHNINSIDFIKVDIEGHEPEFILGAKNTITKFKPKIILEVSKDFWQKKGYSIKETLEIFDFLNYHFYLIKGNEILQSTLQTITEQKEQCNIFLCPKN